MGFIMKIRSFFPPLLLPLLLVILLSAGCDGLLGPDKPGTPSGEFDTELIVDGNEIPLGVRIFWAPAQTNLDKILLQRKENTTEWKQIAELDPSKTEYLDTLVTTATMYTYGLVYKKDGEKSDPLETKFFVPYIDAFGLSTRTFAEDSVKLFWSSYIEIPVTYAIDRHEYEDPWQTIATITRIQEYTNQVFVDANIIGSHRYTYRVRSLLETPITIRPSNEEMAIVPLNRPSSVVAVADRDNVSLSWQDNSSAEVTFTIERSALYLKPAQLESAWKKIASVPANQTTFYDYDPDPLTINYYRISATAGEFNSAASGEATVYIGEPYSIRYTDGFEEDAVGELPAGATWTDEETGETPGVTSATTIEVTDRFSASGSKSLFFQKESSGRTTLLTLPIPTQGMTRGVFRFKIYVTDRNMDFHIYAGDQDPMEDHIASVMIFPDGYVTLTGDDLDKPMTRNVWHDVEVRFYGDGVFGLSLDDGPTGEGFAQYQVFPNELVFELRTTCLAPSGFYLDDFEFRSIPSE